VLKVYAIRNQRASFLKMGFSLKDANKESNGKLTAADGRTFDQSKANFPISNAFRRR
jgi:hypothetical protein